MHTIVDPQQTRLFDPFDNVLTERTRKRLLDGWVGFFVILSLSLCRLTRFRGTLAPSGEDQPKSSTPWQDYC